MKGTVTYNSDGVAEYKIEGRLVGKEEFDQWITSKPIEVPNAQSTMTWPMVNVGAFACHPEQVEECNERARKHGIAAHYNKQGHCIIEDAGAHKKLTRLEGWDYRR